MLNENYKFYRRASRLLLISTLVLAVLFFFDYREVANLKEKISSLEKDLLSEKFNKKLAEENHSKFLKSLKDRGFSTPKFHSFDTLIANVIGRSALNWEEEFVINLGERDGVYLNAPVIYGKYLVGLVRELSHSKAVIKTIFSSRVSIACDLKGFNAVGVLQGKLKSRKNLCLLNYMPKTYDYSLGEFVYSSSKSRIIPQGLLVGTIEAVKENELYKQALVRFPLDLRDLEHVVILVKK